MQLPIEGSSEPYLGELRGRVDRLVTGASQARHRGDDDDVATSRSDEMRDGGPHGPDGSCDVRVDHLAQLIVREVHNSAVRSDSGVRNEPVDSAESLHRCVDDPL